MEIPGNFDRWMFNYKEGNLSAEETAYFETFMLNNPDFSDDVEAWNNAYIRRETIDYPHMESLLKEKGVFADWRNWAAALLLLFGVWGAISYTSGTFNQKKGVYSTRHHSAIQKGSVSLYPFLKGKEQYTQSDLKQMNTTVIQSVLVESDLNSDTKTENRVDQTDAALTGDVTIGKNDHEIGDYSNIYNQETEISQGKQGAYNRKIEIGKLNTTNYHYTGSYRLNPDFDVTPIDLSFKKQTKGSFAFILKKIFNKLDKIAGYPIAIINLRDPELLVPNKNILNFNPGFTGSGGNFRIGMDHRNQWTGSLVNSTLTTLYFDSYNSNSRGGIGGSLTYSDYKGGVYQNILANLYYSPKFVLNKHIVFEPAIKVSMGRLGRSGKQIDGMGAVEFERGNLIVQEPNTTINSNISWFKDYGLGFVLNTDWFYVGGFVDNIAGHDHRIYTTGSDKIVVSPKLITGVIGFDYQSRNKRTVLSPFLTYYQYGTKKEAWAGATAQFNWLTIGASYSSNNEYAASVGLKFRSFKLTYQLDMLESEFLQESFVSHNIGIRFNTKNKTIR